MYNAFCGFTGRVTVVAGTTVARRSPVQIQADEVRALGFSPRVLASQASPSQGMHDSRSESFGVVVVPSRPALSTLWQAQSETPQHRRATQALLLRAGSLGIGPVTK